MVGLPQHFQGDCKTMENPALQMTALPCLCKPFEMESIAFIVNAKSPKQHKNLMFFVPWSLFPPSNLKCIQIESCADMLIVAHAGNEEHLQCIEHQNILQMCMGTC